MSVTLILVRHGETAWNRERRVQGHLDVPLNDEGMRQARATAERLATDAARYGLTPVPGVAEPAIVASDLARAWQTAQAIAQATGLPLAPPEPRLRERAYGDFEGLCYEDIHRDRGAEFARWVSRDLDFNVAGGESLRAFFDRSAQVLTELAQSARGTLVVVTHGGVLDCAYRMATGMPLEQPRTHELLNASLNRIRWDGRRFLLVDWGDVSHWRPALDDTTDAA
ncbi:MAG TPA: histidine phosphatase family protein [Burkholderiaceae bacterium]|nr:histidine phosphatase family protein [Burkholderiaceae bacterium]